MTASGSKVSGRIAFADLPAEGFTLTVAGTCDFDAARQPIDQELP
ncbi:MAG: hypothetical protein ACSLFF_07535 [Solirubrobacterales bacterium]